MARMKHEVGTMMQQKEEFLQNMGKSSTKESIKEWKPSVKLFGENEAISKNKESIDPAFKIYAWRWYEQRYIRSWVPCIYRHGSTPSSRHSGHVATYQRITPTTGTFQDSSPCTMEFQSKMYKNIPSSTPCLRTILPRDQIRR